MDLIRTIVRLAWKRPFVPLFIAILTLAYCVLDNYNPLFTILFGLNAVTGGDLSEGVVSVLQIIFDPQVVPMVILFILGFSLVGALLAGLVASGYFTVLNNALAGRQKMKGEFLEGIRRYFVKMSLVSVRVLFSGFLLAIFLLVASVPAVEVTRAAYADKPELFVPAVFIDALTIGVLFFGLMFFSEYMTFWYPAALNYDKKSFGKGKKVVDANFWGITGSFVVFFLLLAISRVLFAGRDDSFVIFLADWLYKTVLVLFWVTYVFAKFIMTTGQEE